MTASDPTPKTVSSWCRTLALHQEELRQTPGHTAAIHIQTAKRMMNQTAALVRAGFHVVRQDEPGLVERT